MIENSTSRFLISRFLLDENNSHFLKAGDSLTFPDGFDLKLVEINTSSGTAKFSIIQNNSEVYNSTLHAGGVYQYNKDLDGDGKDDNWVIKFNIESINTENTEPMAGISRILMRSPQVLKINNGAFMDNYRINIGKDTKSLEVRLIDPDNDIILKENDITGIIDNAFNIRLYGNGNAAAVVKVPGEKDKISLIGNLDEMDNVSLIGNPEVIQGITEGTAAKKVTGFEGVIAIAMFLAIVLTGYNRRKYYYSI